MSSARDGGCPPAFELERHLVGEPTAWCEHLDACERCRAQLHQLREAAQAFARQRPAELFMRQVARRAEASPKASPWLRRWLLAGLSVSAVALVAAAVLVTPGGESVRLKGAGLEVYVKRGPGEPARLIEGARVAAGDVLRFRDRGEGPAQVAVIERDARGAVTVFAPYAGTRSVAPGPDGLVPGAVTLDDTPGAAALYLVRAQSPFELAELVAAVRAGAAPSCQGCAVQVLRYEKTP